MIRGNTPDLNIASSTVDSVGCLLEEGEKGLRGLVGGLKFWRSELAEFSPTDILTSVSRTLTYIAPGIITSRDSSMDCETPMTSA
jgi:hypothetical protein